MTRFATIKRMSSIKSAAALLALSLVSMGASCHGHMSLANHGQDVINGHSVTIKPCLHSTNETLKDESPENSLHTMKCGETELLINNEELVVNGKSYGKLKEGAPVIVDHGKVLIDSTEATEVASR
jgi:hypothetical protein